MACVVEDVTAPDGTRSKLFDQILQITGSDTEAMKLYLNVMGEPLNEDILQDNGEPDLGDVIHRSDLGFTEKHRGLYSSRDASVGQKTTTATQGVVQSIQQMIDRVDNRLSGKISEREKEKLIRRKQQLEEDKSKIDVHGTIEEVREVALEHIDWAKDVLTNPELATSDELLLGIQLMDAWDYQFTSQMLTEEQKESDKPSEAEGFNKLFLKIDPQAKQVRNNLISEASGRIVEQMNQNMVTASEGEFSAEEIQDFSEVDIPNRMLNMSDFFDMAAEDQRLVQYIDDVLKRAKRNKATRIRQLQDELTEMAEPVDDVSALIQTDDAGNFTGGLVNPYTIEFTEEHQRAMELIAKAQKQARSQGVAAGVSERKSAIRSMRSIGELVDIRYLVDEFENPNQYDSAEEYKNHLRETLGEKEATRAIRSAKEKWVEYKRKRRGFQNAVESEIANGKHMEEDMSSQEYRNERMDQFNRRESPEHILKEFHEGANPTVFNDGWQHAYLAANKENQDSQWENLNDDQRDLANYIRNLYSELFTLLPDHIARRRQENFLPKIEKDAVERFQTDGMKALLSYMENEFYDQITGKEVKQLIDNDSGLPNPMTGLGNSDNVPIRWVFDGDSLDRSELSREILKMTEMFTSMAINYSFMNEVEPQVQLMARIAKENVEDPADSNIIDKIEYNIDSMLYDERRSSRKEPTIGFLTSIRPGEALEDRQEANQIEREREETKEAFDNGDISRTEYNQKISELEGRYAELKGKEVQPFRLIEETIGRFTMFSSLGFDVQTGIANGLFGIMAASVHASAEQDFTTEDFHNAFMTYWNLKMEGSGKVGNLMTNMDILHEIAEIAYGRGKASKQERRNFIRKVTDSPYAILRGTENMIQSVTMISIMMNEKIQVETDSGTQEISLWQGFNDKGEWNSERFGEKPDLEPPKGPTDKNRWTNLRDKVIQVNKRLHGNYDVNSPTDLKKVSWGRLLMMFRSWMPEGFRYRFGKEMKSEQTGRTVKGSYRSPYEAATEFGVAKGPWELLKAAYKKDYKGETSDLPIDEIDIRNMRKVMKDMKWFLGMSTIMIALRQMVDDDDEEDTAREFAAKSLISTMTRIRGDITHYLSPTTPVNLVNNPVPALRTITGATTALNGTKKFLTDPDYRGSPVYQWSDAFFPSQQIHDLGMLLYNVENSGEFSTKYTE